MINSSLKVIENGVAKSIRKQNVIDRIVATYPGVTKLYAMVRFRIIHLGFLEEIEQYLPETGDILDLGCGFGLFSLFMASCRPNARIIGMDINQRRLAVARSSAAKLGIRNVSFLHQDLREWRPDRQIAGAYALDVFHHIPEDTGNSLLRDLFYHLEPGGRFLLKDIDTTNRAKLLFTYALDLLMSPRDQFSYRSANVWQQTLLASGFSQIYLHRMLDILPYPHIFMVCAKAGRESATLSSPLPTARRSDLPVRPASVLASLNGAANVQLADS
jgi:2-polyprenyl-3-methyl-5-hydroxy-6-metoxy-1,4-benzoquinol methylase